MKIKQHRIDLYSKTTDKLVGSIYQKNSEMVGEVLNAYADDEFHFVQYIGEVEVEE